MKWRARPGALIASNGRWYWLIDHTPEENFGLAPAALDNVLVQDFSDNKVTSVKSDSISVVLPAPSIPDYIPEHILERTKR